MSSSTSEAGSGELLSRVHAFFSENKKAILIGTTVAVLAAGGAAYYLSTTSRSDADLLDLEKGDKKKDKKKGKGKKKKSTKGTAGPILEERKPSSEEVSEEPKLTEAEVASLSLEERAEHAATLKTKGNAAYSKRHFTQAIELYTQAMQVSVQPEAVYYSNRAACYMNMSPPNYAQVVEDCYEALKLDPRYVKALNRRATAFEALGRYQDALRDYTAATILDQFKNESAAQSVERVLKTIATKEAEEILKTREPRLPSHTFISSYFAAFRPRAKIAMPETCTTGDNTLSLALDALEARNYPHALSLVNEALEQGISWDGGRAEAFNLRGTFKFLLGDSPGARDDLFKSLENLPSFTQSWVKLASVHMEQGDPVNAFKAFDSAIAYDPKDPDTYYHRGQVYFIMGQFSEAAENYTKSTNLDDSFVFSHIQLAVAQYKSQNLSTSMATFRRTLKKFPDRSEPQNYYGELLLDQQRFQDAVEKFEKAIELEEKSIGPKNVLPLVNKGLALYQWKQDVNSAMALCDQALTIDPECEAAIATLAQLNLQIGNIPRAVEMFSSHANIARSEPELINALTYRYASQAQIEFVNDHPDMAGQLSSMARAL